MRLSDFYVRDETETRFNSKFWARPRGDRESQYLFLRDRDENKFLITKKTVNLAKFCFKNTHPDQDETEKRLSKIEANETPVFV